MTDQTLPALRLAPLQQEERIILLDSLRGLAVLGILLMNIPGFALPRAVISDISVLGEWSGKNFYAWYVVETFVEGSQRAIFSMLFGAGMFLFISRLEKKVSGTMPAEYFVRRQLWLLVFGLINSYILLWYWDILFHYAIFGIIVFAFWRQKPKTLYIAAFTCLVFSVARENVDLYRAKNEINRAETAARQDTVKTPLTTFQRDDLRALADRKERSGLESKKKRMDKNLEAVRGDIHSLYKFQSEISFQSQTAGTYYFLLWDVLLFMFLGLAFFKAGVLTGEAPVKTYLLIFLIGFGAGLPLSYLDTQPMLAHKFNQTDIIKNSSFKFYEVARLLRSLGVFALILLLYKSGWFKWLFALMRPVGQMAFTNYLMQSLMCGLFFYGIGLGMFGKLQRYEMYYVVAAVWVIEIAWSHLWLRYCRFGPLEWLWRSLTYWKWQPLRKQQSMTHTGFQAAVNVAGSR